MGTDAGRFARALFVLAALCASCAWSQGFPSRPIKIVVAQTPGGGPDAFGRIIAHKMTERFGQPVLVENKVGAGGNIAADFVAKSAPDGYTLLLAQNGLSMLPWVYKSLPFDVSKDFAPVGIGVTQAMVVAVANSVPVKTIDELIAYAKKNPGKLFYGSPGAGSPHHFATEWFLARTGTKMTHVPYKGSAGVLTDLASGQVQVLFGAISSTVPFVQSGKIRAIGVAERQRLPQFKDLPTISESLPEFHVNFWHGLSAPAGTPEAVVEKLSEAQRAIVRMPDVREQLARVGLDSNPTSASEMRTIMDAEIAMWGKVVKGAGIQPE